MVANAAPITEQLTVNQVVNEQTAQSVVRGRITVPDQKPDVDEILSVDKTATVKNISIVPDKVIIEGTLSLQVVYVAFKPDQSVHHVHDQIDFTGYVDVPGAAPSMNVKVEIDIEDVSVSRNKKKQCTFDVNAVLSVFAKVTETREVEIVTELPGHEIEEELIKVDDLVGRSNAQVIISDNFRVPDQKPPVEKILDIKTETKVTDTRIVANKVIVDGEVTVQVVYVALKPKQPVHSMHQTFTFSHFVEVLGAEPDMNVEVDLFVEDAEIESRRGRPAGFTAYIVLDMEARVTETKQINVVTSVLDAEFERTLLHVESVVGEDSSQVVAKERFSTPEPKPDVESIIDTTVTKCRVTEKKVIRDKVVVRGYCDVSIVYVAALDSQPVHSMHQRIYFRTFIEIPGAMEGMNVIVKPVVEYIKSSHEGCDIDLETVIKVTVKVTESMQREVVISVQPGEPEAGVCLPGETIEHTIVQGDTLFELAREFGTTVNAIVAQNPGINANNLRVGQVITITCGAMG